ncbi:hypothetical protein VTK56DRAFT_7526 [Thermocarpiscus australiensis]
MATSSATSAKTRPSSTPKGILKKTPSNAPAEVEPPTAASPDTTTAPPLLTTRAQHLAQQEARARARLLQQLRETELKPPVPIETFEFLAQLPRSSSSDTSSSQHQPTAADPSPADAAALLAALQDFRPSEYLDLIEERNCLGKCGYALCPRPRRDLRGRYKLTGRGGTTGGGIARTADLNKWCSDACAARALYLKVQLDNPSYERREADGKLVVRLELREEEGRNNNNGAGQTKESKTRTLDEEQEQLARAMAQLEIDKQKQAKQDASALAVERGEVGFFNQGLVDVTIREKDAVGPAEPPSLEGRGKDTHLMVEGYKSTFGTGQQREEDSDSDDDDVLSTLRW